MTSLKSCFAIYIITFSLLINAQTPLSKLDIEKSLVGRWNYTDASVLPEADTLGLRLHPEEIIYMVFNETGAKLRFSSFIDNEYYEGNYKIYYDKKLNLHQISFNKEFGSCETKIIQIISVTDSNLVIRSCLNPANLSFKKSPTPEKKIEDIRNLIVGNWHYVETTKRNNKEFVISNPVDSLVSYDFSKDSVIIYIKSENQTIVIQSDYSITYNLDFDKFCIYTPQYVRESCAPIPVLYIDNIVNNKMILTKCDNDHYQVTYETLQAQEERRIAEVKSLLQGRWRYNMTAWAFGEDSHRTGEDSTMLIFKGDSLQMILENESGSVVREYCYQLIVYDKNPGAQLIILDYYTDRDYTSYTRTIEQVNQNSLIFEGKTNDKLHVWFSKVDH